MASYERDTTPLSPWAYFGLNFLYAIPVLGFIMLIIHAVKKYLYEFKFELICSSPLIDSNGQVIKFPDDATEITYQVRVTSQAYNYDKTTEPIKVLIPAAIPNTH